VRVANSCPKNSPALTNTKAFAARPDEDSRVIEKKYRVVGNAGKWAVAEDDAKPMGNYATREGALEAVYLAASNDIKSGHGVIIRIEPAPLDTPSTGSRP